VFVRQLVYCEFLSISRRHKLLSTLGDVSGQTKRQICCEAEWSALKISFVQAFSCVCFRAMCSGERSGVGVEQDPLGQNMSLRSVVVGFAVNATGQHQKLMTRSLSDVVSRNITMVLENLLKNYESSQLPTHGRGSK
jgi:hypothetical protein